MNSLKKLCEIYDEYNALNDPNAAIVAFDEPSTQGGFFYTFRVVYKDAFLLKYFTKGEVLRFQEAISAKNQCKAYMDIDFTEPEDIANGEAKVEKIIEQFAEAIERKFGKKDIAPPIRFNAHIPGEKFSSHLIYDQLPMFESPVHVHEIVQYIPGVDLQPYPSYTTPTNRWMRMPYSKKVGKNNPLLPHGDYISHYEDGSVKVDPELFCRGLISWVSTVPSSPYHGLLPKCETPFSLPLEIASPRNNWSSGNATITEQAERILDFLSITYGPFKHNKINANANGAWQTSVYPGIFCRLQNRYHKSHYTFIGSRDCNRVYAMCPSLGCRKMIFFDYEFSEIALGRPKPEEGEEEEQEEKKSIRLE